MPTRLQLNMAGRLRKTLLDLMKGFLIKQEKWLLERIRYVLFGPYMRDIYIHTLQCLYLRSFAMLKIA